MNLQIKSKQKVTDAAVKLFYSKGYSGTSVRDIAASAGVNVALISYHFGGKKGLLEHLMTSFLEGYTTAIETAYRKMQEDTATNCLKETIKNVLTYQQEHVALARFVHREITLDTTLVREVMTTYLMKEKFCYEQMFRTGIEQKEFRNYPVDLLVLQLREMLLMPYLHPQYIREVYHLAPQEAYFKKRYERFIIHWVETYICDEKYGNGKAIAAQA
jgi:AcrR family transcriptional regulator